MRRLDKVCFVGIFKCFVSVSEDKAECPGEDKELYPKLPGITPSRKYTFNMVYYPRFSGSLTVHFRTVRMYLLYFLNFVLSFYCHELQE